MKRSLAILSLLCLLLLSFGGTPGSDRDTIRAAGVLERGSPWADSVLGTLDLEARIAQLMMVAAYSNKDREHEAEVRQLIKERNIGGLIFFQGGPVRQARLTNDYQSVARTPLLLGMDLEWGLSMRLDSTIRYPRQMALGAIGDDALVERMGGEIARQMKRLGVHVSFSPVVDVNNNAANPVINDRSFGEDGENVARKGIAYMRGLQNGGVIATAKHFPGHGDTDSDSHLALPLIGHDRQRLDSLELYPFRRLVQEGLMAVMVAHLEVPALDSTKGVPSTLSSAIVTDLLQREIGFQGLVFTDAMNMKGVSKADAPGEVELRALKAGNDILLFPQDPVKAIERIRLAVVNGEVDSATIERKCLKVLRAKEWAGLANRRPIVLERLYEDLNTPRAELLRRELYAASVTVLKDHHGILPFKDLDELRIASLVIGDSVGNPFQQGLQRYARVRTFRCDKALRPDSLEALLRKLDDFDRVIVSVHGTSWRVNKEFGVPGTAMDILRAIAARKPTVLALFANPYALTRAYGANLLASVVVAYEETEETQDLVSQVLFGGIGASGHLPVTVSSFYAMGDGIVTKPTGRMSYSYPEAADLSRRDLEPIDAIVRSGIDAQAYPGCELLVALDGQVIINKAYGYHTYEKLRPVRTSDLYDLASITKVASTTLALMRLVDEGAIDLDKRLGHYLPEIEGEHTAHARMQLRDILTHQAGLRAFVPFYTRTMKDGRYKANSLSDSATETYTIRVVEGLYLNKAYQDSLLTWVLRTPLGAKGEYVYSDMGYYLLQEVIERSTGMPLDRYVSRTFYQPMGAATMGYRPWERYSKQQIAPTENDQVFRKRLVHGDVHDPGAAMKGGVAGHAGLFSNANDLAKVMQLLLNGGVYGGRRYLSEEVIKEFTRCQFCKPDGSGNRRGLGWDKPARNGKGPTCECVSYASFGHTGFTGTMAWADPEQNVVYIFLSNRVYPSAERNKLAELNIRTRIQEVVHDAVGARYSAVRVAPLDP